MLNSALLSHSLATQFRSVVSHVAKQSRKDDIAYHLQTLYLFIRSDIKTVVGPVSIFAHVAAPSLSWSNVPLVLVWILLHTLLIDVDNQSLSIEEDRINKPWRPLPSGRVTEAQIKSSLWLIFPACLLLSASFGVVWPGLVYAMLVFSYDHFDLAGHWFWKNAVNAGGYLSLETATTMIAAGGAPLDKVSLMALASSGLVVFTTIHIQDIQDEVGDRKIGRDTIPIRFGPNLSRGSVSVMVLLWSLLLPYIWDLHLAMRLVVACLGGLISWRQFYLRDNKQSDELTYRIFNIWLVMVHVMAAPTRLSNYLSA